MNESISATDNPIVGATDNPTAEPVATSSGTGATGGQAQGGAPTDDLFKGVDPNRLPPEVKAHYDSMLRDYRDKTAKLSETTKSEIDKAVQAYKQKAEYYDQFSSQEEFVKQWNEHVQKANAPAAQPGQAGDSQIDQLKAQLQEVSQKIQMSELSQVTDAFANAVDEKGEKIHPEFDAFNDLHLGEIANGQEKEPFSFLRACIELSPGNSPQEKLANGYKKAKEVHDEIFEKGRKAGLGKLQSKVLNGSLPPTNVNANLSTTDKKPKNAHEAIEMAKKGLMVSR